MQACQSQKVPALPQIPASLLKPCDEYQSLKDNSMGELLTRYIESLEIGAEYAAKVDAYIEIHKPK